MVFSKNEINFPSIIHRSVYITALRQTPLAHSLANPYPENICKLLLNSCKTYHEFVMDMLADMYENPDEYEFNAGEYDTFLDGHKESYMKRKFKSRTLTLRSKTYNQVPGYFNLLISLAKSGIPDDIGTSLYINEFAFENIRNSHSKQFMGLKHAGLTITNNPNGSAVITSEKYPNMFLAMSKLAKSADKVQTFGEHNFYHTDFRQIFNGYTPRYEDVVSPLNDEQKSITDTLHSYARKMGLTASCTTYWKANYHYKGKHVMCIDTDNWMYNKFVHNFRVRIDGGHSDLYLNTIENEGDDFKKYFVKHLNYCTACSPSHLAGIQKIYGKTVRLCGNPSFRITNPDISDIGYIEKFIDLRCNSIINQPRYELLRSQSEFNRDRGIR